MSGKVAIFHFRLGLVFWLFPIDCRCVLAGVLGDLSKRNGLKLLLVFKEVLHHEERNALLFWASHDRLIWHSLWPMRLAHRLGFSCLIKVLMDPFSRNWVSLKGCYSLQSLVGWTLHQ